MAKQIIKEGTKVFTTTCPICGCEFSYEIEDLELSLGEQTVRCPSCDRSVPHKNHHNSIGYEPNIVPLPYTPYNSPTTIPYPYKIDITCTSKNS